MQILLIIVETAGGFFIVLMACFAWMWLVRRQSGCQQDQDVLEHMAHGCAGCKGDGACHNRNVEKEHHELA